MASAQWTLDEAVAFVRAKQRHDRTVALAEILFGSDNLAFNAELVTALRLAQLWPMGCKP